MPNVKLKKIRIFLVNEIGEKWKMGDFFFNGLVSTINEEVGNAAVRIQEQ